MKTYHVDYTLENDGRLVVWSCQEYQIKVPLEPYRWSGGRAHYRFSFLVDGVELVSHDKESDSGFFFSPGAEIMGIDPMFNLLGAAASFMTVSRDDGVDDDFFSGYNAKQLAWLGSMGQENYTSVYYDAFWPEADHE